MTEFFGTTGSDSLDITQTGSITFGGASADTITGLVPVNPANPTTGGKYFGGAANDIIYVQNGDRVFGGEGDDEIWNTGGGANNNLFGGAGDDKIYGGKDDILVGGKGADEFWLVQIPQAPNTILDFNSTEGDQIVIDSVTGITKESLVLDTTTSSGDTLLKFGNVTLTTVKGVALTLDDIVISSVLTPDSAPSDFPGAVDLGTVGTVANPSPTKEGSFFNGDVDMYKFKIDNPSDVTIDLTGMFPSSIADLFLIKDDGDGKFEASEDTFLGASQTPDNTDKQIKVEALAAGEYFIDISQVAGFSNYELKVEAVSNFAGLTEDNGGNTFDAAGDLGTLAATPITKAGSFSSQDVVDAFSFVIDDTANVKVTLSGTGLNEFNYADLFLIQDDGDNSFEASEDTFLGVSQTPGSAQEFTVTNLLAGEYFIKIDHVAGAANYTLNLEADKVDLIPDNGGLDFASAGDLGTLEVTNPITKEGSFTILDNVDMFSFVIDNTTPVNVKVTLDGSFDQSNYADLFLIKDNGDNEYIAADDVIKASQIVGSDQEITMSDLSAGEYFISINHVLGLANYTLGLAIV